MKERAKQPLFHPRGDHLAAALMESQLRRGAARRGFEDQLCVDALDLELGGAERQEPGHRLVADLPSRAEIYEEIFFEKDPGPRT